MRDKLGRFIKGNHVSSEFKKGHKPWHDGMKGLCLNTGRTQFKKDQLKDEKHHFWKGDEVGYSALHSWIKRKLGKPFYCMKCGIISTSKRYEWANISGEYKRDLDDWVRLCRKCHVNFDDILKKSWKTRKDFKYAMRSFRL